MPGIEKPISRIWAPTAGWSRDVNPSWFTKRRVFGTSGYPWTSPDYTGNPDREFACPNSLFVNETNFNLQILESWGDEEIDDCVRIFSKVESAYAR